MKSNNYDVVVNAFKNAPAIDRVIPIGEELEVSDENVIPHQKLEEILNKFDIFGVSYCYCRHRKDLLGDPCKVNAPRENCLSFAKLSRYGP